MDKCEYSDGQESSIGEHKFDKNDFCIFCGKTREQTEYVKPIKTSDWWNDLYTDANGDCFSDADPGL